MDYPKPTLAQLRAAQDAFEELEPRSFIYRASLLLVDLATKRQTDLTVAEALSVLLQVWNKAYYQYHPINNRHLSDLESCVSSHWDEISDFRKRTIDSLSRQDDESVTACFSDLEKVLGPVGAAKVLHLLAPEFFALWDRAIAKGYRLPLKKVGDNARGYLRFMEVTRDQAACVGGQIALGRNPLKALDEWNYCKFTKKSASV